MAVFEFKVEIPAERAAEWAARLAEDEEQRVMVTEDQPSGRAWLVGYFASRAEARQAWAGLSIQPDGAGAQRAPSINELAEADWKESYKSHFKPWRFGPLHWVPEWERRNFRPAAGEHVLWLDPGMAFGTGNHETTRLCCERLVAFAANRGTTGRVLDAGCGSGILALSAARLGFTRVQAFDHDPVAVAVSRKNAELNGLGGRVEFFTEDLIGGLTRTQADLALANVQADVLIRHARDLCRAVAPGGQLVLSGILAREMTQVRAVFRAEAPGSHLESRVLGEWSDLVLTRSA